MLKLLFFRELIGEGEDIFGARDDDTVVADALTWPGANSWLNLVASASLSVEYRITLFIALTLPERAPLRHCGAVLVGIVAARSGLSLSYCFIYQSAGSARFPPQSNRAM